MVFRSYKSLTLYNINMKTTRIYLLITIIAVMLSSCGVWEHHIIPSKDVSTLEYSISDYSGIDASHAFRVYVTFSDSEESIEIEANDNLHEYIEVKKENNTLVIGIRRGISISRSPKLNAFIKTRNLSYFAGSGATKFQLANTVVAPGTSIYLSGSSSFTGDVETNEIVAKLSGSSSMNISGSSEKIDAELSGASSIRDYNMNTNILKVELSGASSAFLTVDQQIDVRASGASKLQYKGSASIIHQDLSGSSSVKKVY